MLLDNVELIQTAENIAEEKGIEKELVFQAIEKAISKAGKVKYGNDYDIRGNIDRKTGKISLARYLEVKKDVEDNLIEISLKDAKKKRKDIKIGEFVIEELPDIDIGRISAQVAKQVLVQNIKEAESVKNFELYKDKIGETITGLVKRMEFGNIIIDLGNAEGVIKKDEMIPRENLRRGDRIKAYLYNVNQDTKGPQIFLSRSHPQFLANLFKQEVPEINDNVIEIKSVARDPGSRAKIAVHSADQTIDPVGACVGMRGSRVQAVVTELQGEKIDIVTWSEDKATYIVNSLAPAQISKVIFEEDNTDKIKVIIPEDQLSLAIGRKGQNVRLASILTNCEIDIIDEKDEKEKRNEEIKKISETFMKELDVDEVIAHLLATEGFLSIDEIGNASDTDFKAIEGFDENLIKDLKDRATQNLVKKNKELEKKKIELNISKELEAIKKLTLNNLITLGENNIKNLNDLAELSSDELIEMLNTESLKKGDADEIIMKARENWFKEDKKENIKETSKK
ncbi:MAG: hypothetical protein CFH26_00081 [Alphaproteobacteria bacterium MarineAlpha6_Bin4]|nr:MAG: hypothetical protein CFH27_00048 [Alphaproteobacteria bacterium MarineAlpha6_Bin5]PPR38353.1 MAG: hypothetical protein CFH26_00081 [Alphaproteobacteria bacterium MarineAlpha6_Bin4]|tara:strand:+ start:888 stop:2420 length:1533 start_codon:yes stop_codon:yes gene_type:complete